MNPSPEGAERSRQENCEWLGESKVPKETYGLKIPAHWRWSTFGDLSDRETVGHVGSMKDEYQEAGIPFLRGQNVRANRYDSKGLKYVSAAFHKSLKKSALEPFDIVVTRSGDVGIACVIPEHLGEANCSDLVIIKRPHWIDSHFAAYYLNSAAKRFITAGKVGVAITHFNTKSVADLPVPLPPLPEQRRIVARIEELFSRLDAGVAALRHAKAQLQRYRQSVLAAAVTGQLTQAWREQHPDTEPAEELLKRILKQRREQWDGRGKYSEPASPKPLTFDLPSSSWARVSIDQLAVDTTIGLVRAAVLQNSSEEGFAYLKMDKIDMNGRVNLDGLVYVDATKDEVARFSLRKGDVLFNTRNSVELVGKTGHVASEPVTPLVFNNNLMRLRFVGTALPAFVALQMCSKQFRDRMEGAKRATTSIAAVYGKDLRPLPIALPPLAEQQQIVAEVEARTTAIDHLEAELDRQITRSNRLRQSALASAFAGNLIPNA
jgi:type I restriction enzyme S subunit